MRRFFSWCSGVFKSSEKRADAAPGVDCRLCYLESLAANGSAHSRCLRHRRVRVEAAPAK